MPVEMKIAIVDGWKQEDNKRFGQCLEIRFINTADNKIMFRYAPYLKDEAFWLDVFNKLKTYDRMHKDIFSLVQTINGESQITMGDCKND